MPDVRAWRMEAKPMSELSFEVSEANVRDLIRMVRDLRDENNHFHDCLEARDNHIYDRDNQIESQRIRIKDLESDIQDLDRQIFDLTRTITLTEKERDDALEDLEDLENEMTVISEDYEKDCGRALRWIATSMGYEYDIDGNTADDVASWVIEKYEDVLRRASQK